ncbi:hypothetical protein Tco_1097430, partial [Tanacetum coccineum]
WGSREHQRHENRINQVFDREEVHNVSCYDVYGLGISFGYSKLLQLLLPIETMELLRRLTWQSTYGPSNSLVLEDLELDHVWQKK